MANIKSAKKRIKVIDKKTARNIRVKNFLAAVESGDAEAAKTAFQHAEKKLMQAAAKGTFHKNAVARKISRFEKKLNALSAK